MLGKTTLEKTRDYALWHLAPALILSALIVTLLWFFETRGVRFWKTHKYLDKELVIKNDYDDPKVCCK